MFFTQGKSSAHESSIIYSCEVMNLPKQVEIRAVKGHQAERSVETIDNQLVNGDFQKVALLPEVSGVLPLLPVAHLLSEGGEKWWWCLFHQKSWR